MSAAPSIARGGFDEAGLGPTLGPLVVGGLITSVRGDRDPAREPVDDLSGPLAAIVGPPGTRDGRLELGDSKKIHTGTRKLARLERTALATVAWVHGRVPRDVPELLALVDLDDFEAPGDRRAPWFSALDEDLPVAVERGEVEELGARLSSAAAAAGIRPLWFGADLISAARINRELEAEAAREGTKNTWATHCVLRVLRRAVESVEAPRLSLWCDKAGGRAAYEEPLRRALPLDRLGSFARLAELRERSHYRLELAAPKRRLELGFVMGGDRLDPRISWGSILAKYLRELSLRAFNRYFAARVNGLRPTAGYPQDARRFIAAVDAALGPEALDRAMWIRSK